MNSVKFRGLSQEFHSGVKVGADKRMAEGHATSGAGTFFWNFCFEIVHFGAYLTAF